MQPTLTTQDLMLIVDCGARAYHKPTCPRLSQEDNRVFAAQTF